MYRLKKEAKNYVNCNRPRKHCIIEKEQMKEHSVMRKHTKSNSKRMRGRTRIKEEVDAKVKDMGME